MTENDKFCLMKITKQHNASLWILADASDEREIFGIFLEIFLGKELFLPYTFQKGLFSQALRLAKGILSNENYQAA